MFLKDRNASKFGAFFCGKNSGPEENRTPFYSMPWSYTASVLRARILIAFFSGKALS